MGARDPECSLPPILVLVHPLNVQGEIAHKDAKTLSPPQKQKQANRAIRNGAHVPRLILLEEVGNRHKTDTNSA